MDTKTEDEDLYRFLDDIDRVLNIRTTRVADGRDIWQTAVDNKFIPNSRVDVCSKILKRDVFDSFFKIFSSPGDAVVYGFHAGEIHRAKRLEIRAKEKGVVPLFPLLDSPEIFSEDAREFVEQTMGVRAPRLYYAGFSHNNCGGFCFKAGQAQFAKLLKFDRERYLYHETKEQEVAALIGKPHTILRRQRGGVKHNLSLKQLREELEAGIGCDMKDTGTPCDCMGVDNV
jgi:hypothetical protein